MEVLVAGWIGSTNLGDELVFAGLASLLRERGATVTAVSVDPAATRRVHGVAAVAPAGVLAAAGRADAVVFGGGGLLQDETSALNLPYHLSRVWAARARRTPVVGLGLGAGRLTTGLGRALVRTSLAGVPLTVRDAASADLLAGVGLPRPAVAADLALSLPPVHAAPRDRLVVCLRPWTGRRGRLLPASRQARADGRQARADGRQPGDDGRQPSADGRHPSATRLAPEPLLRATAQALDETAAATGLAPHLVALQADRDGPLHDAVAERMRAPVTTARPDLASLPAEVASGRAVAAMRYHGGICAVLAGRPAVLIGYSPKVDALAAELGPGGRLLPWSPDGPAGLARAVQGVLGQDSAVRAAAAALRERSARHAPLLDRIGC
jgi:polysaccharide pyruvyl transferase WcaK-like protein